MNGTMMKNDKYQIAILIIVVFFILLVIFALIFRHVDKGRNSKNSVGVVLTDGDLSINYVDGQEIHVKNKNENTYIVSITNTGTKKTYYSISFLDLNNTEGNVIVEDLNGKEINSIENNLDVNKIINLYSLKEEETVRYNIKIKATRGNIKGKLVVSNESLTSDSFADVLLTKHAVGTALTRVGSEISTIDEGLLSTIDNKGTTYYFRGDINYNYAKLGNNLFRIVRINGNGTVRLVLDDTISVKAPYNTTQPHDNITINLMANLNNASIDAVLVDWYNKNLEDYKKYIVASDFCTDVNFNVLGNGIQYSNTHDRVFVDNTPDLYCSGALYSRGIGLLTADEIILAGAYRSVANDKYYLYNSNIKEDYITLSSYALKEDGLYMINVKPNGALGDGLLSSTSVRIRPVISIGQNAKIKGDGSKGNPYIIVA